MYLSMKMGLFILFLNLLFSASAQDYKFHDAHERCTNELGEFLMPIGLLRRLNVLCLLPYNWLYLIVIRILLGI